MQPYMPDGSPELQPENADFLGTFSLIPYAIVAAANAPFDDLKSLAEYSQASGPAKMSSTSAQLTVGMEQLGEELGINFVAAQTSGSGESLQLVAGRHADFTISGGVNDGATLNLTLNSAGISTTDAIDGATINYKVRGEFTSDRSASFDVRGVNAGESATLETEQQVDGSDANNLTVQLN